jgi:hypothetical protein
MAVKAIAAVLEDRFLDFKREFLSTIREKERKMFGSNRIVCTRVNVRLPARVVLLGGALT